MMRGIPVTRRRGIGGRLGLALASFALSAGLGAGALELWLRHTRPAPTLASLRARSLDYEPTLFARHAFPQRVQELPSVGAPGPRINALGYRGPDFTPEKPSGVTRVVVLGGSAAFDAHARRGLDWPRQLEARLRAAGHRELEVVNAGTPGHAAVDSLGRLYSEIWTFEPDLVLVYHGWNDIKTFVPLSAETSLLRMLRPPPSRGPLVENPFTQPLGRVDAALARSQLYLRVRRRWLEWRLGMLGPEGLLRRESAAAARWRAGEGLAPSYPARGPRQLALVLELIAGSARAVGARPVFVTQARLLAPENGPAERARLNLAYVGLDHAAALRAYADVDAALRDVAAREQAPLLEASARLSGRSELFVDHVHTTAAGSEALARFLAEELETLL